MGRGAVASIVAALKEVDREASIRFGNRFQGQPVPAKADLRFNKIVPGVAALPLEYAEVTEVARAMNMALTSDGESWRGVHEVLGSVMARPTWQQAAGASPFPARLIDSGRWIVDVLTRAAGNQQPPGPPPGPGPSGSCL